MDVRTLPIIEVDDSPPVLDLTPRTLKHWLANWQCIMPSLPIATTAKSKPIGGHKYRQGLLLPIPRKSIQPMA